MEKMKFESPDMTAQNIDRLAALFPNCVTEMLDEEHSTPEKKVYKRAVNFELLKQMLSPDVVDGDEAYEFTWVGKKAAIVEANKPIRKTLRPCVAESKDWDTTENLYIEGDNLEVLKLLQESYLGKVKMIYIDPPYNTGNDFIYADDFMRSQQEENQQMGMYDEDENRLFKNTDTNGKFHSDWCSMIYSRLMLARNLLTDDGVIFISIDEHEVDNMRKMGSEIFGEENFIAQLIIVSNQKGRNDSKHFAICHEYLLVFGKYKFVANGLPLTEEQRAAFNLVDEDGNFYQLRDLRKRGNADRRTDRPLMYFPIFYNPNTHETSLTEKEGSIEIVPTLSNGEDGRWRWGKDRVQKNLSIIEPFYSARTQKWGVNYRVYLDPKLNPLDDSEEDEKLSKAKTVWNGGDISSDVAKRTLKSLLGCAPFDFPKAVALLQKAVQIGTVKDSIILDFFSGSATTAHAVMQLNAEDGGHRKFIMVQLPEKCDESSEAYKAGYKNICEIGKERIRRAGDKIRSESPMTTQDLDIGFRVLKLDDTNMKDVYYAPDDYDQGMLAGLESNIKDDRTDLDLLFGCLIDWGLPLSLPYQSEQIDGCTVHTYNDGDLIACFDANIPESVVKEIAKRKPLRAVFRDSGFASSPEKINVFEIFKLYMPEDANDISKRVRVI